MTILLGLDVGTSSLKAVAYDAESGKVAAQAAAPTPVSHPRPDWTDYDPVALWQGMASCIRQVVDALPEQSVAAVAVASMGEAGVPLDAGGTPLYPIIAWFDPRSDPQSEQIRDDIGAERTHLITGQQVRNVFTLSKLLWLRQEAPDVFKRMALWLCMEDYVLWRLSGAAATDYTIASRTMLFDQARREWSPELLAYAGMSASVLPQPFPSGTVIGAVSGAAAQQTGLLTGTPVVTGGHDHLCGTLAVGAIETGRFLDSSGTAQAMLMPIDAFHGGGQVFAHGFTCYRHVLRDRFVVQGGLNTAGGALEWVVKTTGCDAYESIFAEAAASGPGARGVVCLPHFRGSTTPYIDPQARAAFTGLTLEHRRGDLMRAVIEGLAYYLRLNLEHMAQAGPVAGGHMLAIGGGNREPLVLQTKADVCNRPVVAPSVPEATAVGAALLAGLAIGVFPDEHAAAASVACDFRRYEPDERRAQIYDKLYREAYLPLYPALKALSGAADHSR